jgi:diguanylate cyclase (GGDEF)-like protein
MAGGFAAARLLRRRPAPPPPTLPEAAPHGAFARRHPASDLGAHVSDLEAIADATRELARSTDLDSARHAICDAARQVSSAEVAILFEPSEDGRGLTVSASLGVELRGVKLPFAGQPSGAVAAFHTRKPHFIPDLVGHPAVFQPLAQQTGARSAMWQPVLREREASGVLTVAWRQRFDQLDDRLASLMALLAAEAAVAIERADLLARLEAVARTDDLTGLPNRRCWEEELPRELARAGREHQPVCVAMLDLDQFKNYNDRFGHQAGDRLLREAAAAWRSRLRVSDLIARYGGEEFSVVLPGCPPDEAISLVERLRVATPEGQSCSAGVATWDGVESPVALVGRADSALYDAKQSGRDRTTMGAAARGG